MSRARKVLRFDSLYIFTLPGVFVFGLDKFVYWVIRLVGWGLA